MQKKKSDIVASWIEKAKNMPDDSAGQKIAQAYRIAAFVLNKMEIDDAYRGIRVVADVYEHVLETEANHLTATFLRKCSAEIDRYKKEGLLS